MQISVEFSPLISFFFFDKNAAVASVYSKGNDKEEYGHDKYLATISFEVGCFEVLSLSEKKEM